MEKLSSILFGGNYELTRIIFQRGMALTYFIAFLVALKQFKALLGEKGLLPVPEYLKAVSFRQAPSIFHFHYSDAFLTFIVILGLLLSLAALSGITEKGSIWISIAVWSLLWIFYLSIVNVGQTFYSFGWETMLLEAGFLTIFLGSSRYATPLIILFLLRWMLFRLEFGAGLIKLRGDPCWRDLTCMLYHHETQPMPSLFSWYFHHLPPILHKVEVIGNYFAQLVVPWGLFLPQPIASISALIIIITQGWLFISGNYAWLGFLTMVLATTGFSNTQIKMVLPNLKVPDKLIEYPAHLWSVTVVTAMFILLSYRPLINLFSRRQMMNTSYNAYHLVNSYGAFGSVTKERYEIIIEGTSDETIDENTEWKAYEFKAKPGDPAKRPPQYAPYHLRLDWLMWFAAFDRQYNPYHHPWFGAFIGKLLQNDKATLKLIKTNPFPDTPPKHIRAELYLYHFTTSEERKKTGDWWHRELVGTYLPPATLK